MDELDSARKEMGFVDNAIVSLVLERMEIVRRMGAIKHSRGLPVLPEGFTLEKAIAGRVEKAAAVGAGEDDKIIVGKTFAVLVQAAIDAEGKV